MLNLYADVPSFLPGLIGLIVLLTIFFVFLSLAGLFFKKRSTISAIMFVLALGSVSLFLLNLELDGELLSDTILSLGKDLGIGSGIYAALNAFASPIYYGHVFFVSMIANIFMVEINDPSISFISGNLFPMIIYVVLFVLSFIFFNRKKKSKRIYSDYLS